MGVDGNKLRELRLKEGIGQVDLANRVGVTQGMISQLETGCRNAQADTIEAIARELHCSYEDIAGEPPIWVTLMRNCKGLSQSQLKALNTVAVELAKCGSPADTTESAGTSTNIPSAPCNHEIDLRTSGFYCVKCGARPRIVERRTSA